MLELNKLEQLVQEWDKLEAEIADPAIYTDPERSKLLMRKKKKLEKIVQLIREYKKTLQRVAEARQLLANEKDPEMTELAQLEMDEAGVAEERLEEEIKVELLPKDENDDKDVFVEIRAGTGGDEAELFAGELANMYMRYAEIQGWKVELINDNREGAKAKEVVFRIGGENVYSKLKFESGVHRVQRIPVTESKGRIHTSAATVAVLPEVEDVQIEIRPEDLEVMACRASGAGGQKVNKTNSAIRIVHLPTGIAVECQEGRSQGQNKEKALNMLKMKLFSMEEEKRLKAIGDQRSLQVGSGDRSEKIRTYNFPQDRLTDHRVHVNWSNLPAIMMGDINDIIERLIMEDRAQKLAAATGH